MGFDLAPLIVSLKTTTVATIVTFLLGLPAAYWMAGYRGRLKGVLDGIFVLPLVLPPTVAGFLLLLLFGRNGPLGPILHRLDMNIVFSWSATVIAAVVVSFPMMYRTAKGAFEQVKQDILSAARTLGASELRIFFRIGIPTAWPGIVAGAILAFARALGEFGATIMLAGNIPGKTQTIPLAIYFAVEGGDDRAAYGWVVLIICISLLVISLMNFWLDHQQKYIGNPVKRRFKGMTKRQVE